MRRRLATVATLLAIATTLSVACAARRQTADTLAARALVAPRAINPILIVPGWSDKGAAWQFAEHLISFGVPRAHIHVIRYDSTADWDIASAQFHAEFQRVADLYADGDQRFDIIAHSVGQFIALHAIVNDDLEDRVGRLIGVSGIVHGIRATASTRVRDLFADAGDSMESLRRSPDDSLPRPLARFLNRNARAIDRLDKCSVFSPDDGVLDPYNSGAFENSRNTVINGMRHEWAFTSRRFARAIVDACYSTKWPKS